jgi:hypothetical protein
MPIELVIVFLVIACAGSLLSRSRWNSPKRQWERHIRQNERDRKRMVKQ